MTHTTPIDIPTMHGGRAALNRSASLHVERAEPVGIDDTNIVPFPPVRARDIVAATGLPSRHRARANVLTVVARVVLIEAAIALVVGAALLLLRWGGVL